jgi:hypothetical protein
MLLATLCLLFPQEPAAAQAPRDLAVLLRTEPTLAAVLDDARGYRLQILLAEPVVTANGRLELVRSRLGDERQYFYPASAIKLCAGIAALLHLNEENRAHGTGLGLATRLSIEPTFAGDVRIAGDASNVVDGTLTIGHLLRKMLLVSDNAAFNHCYELCGQEGLNEAMWGGGFASVRLWHRLSESRTPAENQKTRSLVLCTGDIEQAVAPRDAGIKLENDLWRDLDVGNAYLQGGKKVDAPMSFAQKNAILLQDLQDVLVETVRPEIDTGKLGFPGLSIEQRAFVVKALGELPRESTNPRYDPAKVPDHSCKFILRGVRKVIPAEHVRIYEKIGRAYGFSVENAYVEDARTGRGFFLAIVLYTNPDGVLNDDRYAYEELADPFLDGVGEVITRAVMRGL